MAALTTNKEQGNNFSPKRNCKSNRIGSWWALEKQPESLSVGVTATVSECNFHLLCAIGYLLCV